MSLMLDSPAAAGPDALLALERRWMMPCVHHFFAEPLQIVGGEGCRLVDHEGRRYLDAYSGVSVMNAGHSNPAILEPAIDQLRRLQHVTTIHVTEPAARLAAELAVVTPGALCRTFLCASGSESVETALQLACTHTRRSEIVAFVGGLHGRTRWAMNATGLEMWRNDPFPLPGVHHVPFGDAEALARLLAHRGDRVAAVIGEPVQGNGGIRVPDAAFWPEVRRQCDRHGALMILDEVQTGFGRTGRWFAAEHWSVAPDIVCLSKALGNGFPVAATVASNAVAGDFTRPSASTYGSNPFCCAAALATIAYHREHDLAGRAARAGSRLLAGLRNHARTHAGVCDEPRGLGLMLGLPMRRDGAPSSDRCDAALEGLRRRGVLAGKTGAHRDVVTFMPPLVITDEETEEMLDALDHALDSID